MCTVLLPPGVNPIAVKYIIPFLLTIRNVSDKSCRENQNTLFVFSNFFPPENRALYEITWKNIV